LIVLSLFDGMACGRLALERAGIKKPVYYASEIDKWAIKVAKKNWPDIVHLGDVTKWKTWDIPRPDLIMAGSPCQGFSPSGKGLGFDDLRSRLFFVFIDILRHYRPRWWLLENVVMKKEWRDRITEIMGVEPVRINSALVSAQNRRRDYWCNWPVSQPEDRGIMLKDIIDSGRVDRDKSRALTADYRDGASMKQYICYRDRQIVLTRPVIIQRPHGYNKGGIRAIDGKVPTLTRAAWEHNNHLLTGDIFRKLTPVECERLQTLPDNYTEGVSKTQRYKMIGNGWTVDVIAHILSEPGGPASEL